MLFHPLAQDLSTKTDTELNETLTRLYSNLNRTSNQALMHQVKMMIDTYHAEIDARRQRVDEDRQRKIEEQKLKKQKQLDVKQELLTQLRANETPPISEDKRRFINVI